MREFKHYSFDLWLTLIKSNPLFKIERTKIFHRRYNPLHKSIDEVAAIFRQVDVMCNNINEKTGKNIDAEEMYLIVISMISESLIDMGDIEPEVIYSDMENLLFEFLPMIYSDETIQVLDHLKGKNSCTLSILSNTGFIKGATLREVLKQNGLNSYFDFQLYSDEAGMSKPNMQFFNMMLNEVKSCNKQCTPDDIIHVGDNHRADIMGAELAGINKMLINSNEVSITTLICKEYQPILFTK